ncbi:IS4 family transposase, partial [Clostridium sp. DL1XJH146]
FVKRKSKLTEDKFLSLCTFSGEDLCTATLVKLCSRLNSNEDASISPQALNNRFNSRAVDFMRSMFNEMMKIQNKVLSEEEQLLKTKFERITVADSTRIRLPDQHKKEYKGSSHKSEVKVQLQFDLLSGEFILCDVMKGYKNDQSYIPKLQETVMKGDLCLKDLGYFKIADLKFIESKQAYYISKIKINMNLFKREEVIEYGFKGKSTIRQRYSPIDIYKFTEPLAEGETLELPEIYLGNTNKNRIKTRLIVTKLSEENKRKREDKHNEEIKKQRRVASKRNEQWASINVYATNAPVEILDTLKVHDMYSLRWQCEIFFKIWKSLFNIDKIKKTKIERFQCFLYGRLIAILLTLSIVFTSRKLVYLNENKEISEIKSFGIVQEFFRPLRLKLFKSEFVAVNLLIKIYTSIKKLGIKSKKKGRKTSLFILKDVEITEDELLKMAS